jgi:hypothetical protein
MANTKTKSISIPTEQKYVAKILAKSTVRNYQRKKILVKQIKEDAYKRFKKYSVTEILFDVSYNAIIQKYSWKNLPKLYYIKAKFINTTKLLIILEQDTTWNKNIQDSK